MTIAEAAVLLGLKPNSLTQQRLKGKLHMTKRAGRWYISEAEASRYAAEHRRKDAR